MKKILILIFVLISTALSKASETDPVVIDFQKIDYFSQENGEIELLKTRWIDGYYIFTGNAIIIQEPNHKYKFNLSDLKYELDDGNLVAVGNLKDAKDGEEFNMVIVINNGRTTLFLVHGNLTIQYSEKR